MEEKLDLILKNQLLIYDKLLELSRLVKQDINSQFMLNYLADIAGTVTAELGLTDYIKKIKNKERI